MVRRLIDYLVRKAGVFSEEAVYLRTKGLHSSSACQSNHLKNDSLDTASKLDYKTDINQRRLRIIVFFGLIVAIVLPLEKRSCCCKFSTHIHSYRLELKRSAEATWPNSDSLFGLLKLKILCVNIISGSVCFICCYP